MKLIRSNRFAVVGIFWGATCCSPALTQTVTRAGNAEIGVFSGASYGLDRWRVMAGGNVAYALTRELYLFGEASYLPGVLRTNNISGLSPGSRQEFSITMTDVHGALHYRFPVPETRLIPYVDAGIGVIHGSSSTAYIKNVSPSGTEDKISQTLPSSNSFGVNFGGGLRIAITPRLGFRMEALVFKPTSAPVGLNTNAFYRFAVGPYIQVR